LNDGNRLERNPLKLNPEALSPETTADDDDSPSLRMGTVLLLVMTPFLDFFLEAEDEGDVVKNEDAASAPFVIRDEAGMGKRQEVTITVLPA
jgi:hypothetical protein